MRKDNKALELVTLNPWWNGVGWLKKGKVYPGGFQVENRMLGNVYKRRENGLRLYFQHYRKTSSGEGRLELCKGGEHLLEQDCGFSGLNHTGLRSCLLSAIVMRSSLSVTGCQLLDWRLWKCIQVSVPCCSHNCSNITPFWAESELRGSGFSDLLQYWVIQLPTTWLTALMSTGLLPAY